MELLLKVSHTVNPDGMVTNHNGEMMPKLRQITIQDFINWKNYITEELKK